MGLVYKMEEARIQQARKVVQGGIRRRLVADQDVVVQSTTRSPVLVWGAVASALAFPDNYGEGVGNFLYNVMPRQYDHVLICHETAPNAALLHLARLLDARLLHFVNENYVSDIPVC